MVICEGLITLLLLTYHPLQIEMKLKEVSSMVLSIVESTLQFTNKFEKNIGLSLCALLRVNEMFWGSVIP